MQQKGRGFTSTSSFTTSLVRCLCRGLVKNRMYDFKWIYLFAVLYLGGSK